MMMIKREESETEMKFNVNCLFYFFFVPLNFFPTSFSPPTVCCRFYSPSPFRVNFYHTFIVPTSEIFIFFLCLCWRKEEIINNNFF